MIAENEQSREWNWEILRYSQEQAPRVVSSVLGITICEAADRLLEAGSDWDAGNGFREIASVAKVLGRRVQSTNLGLGRRVGQSARVQITDRFPTVGRWLKDHPANIAVLRVSDKVIYVGYGSVFGIGDSFPVARSRVTHAIFLD